MSANSLCTRVDLLRHGHCLGGDIFRGHTDSALSPQGWQQMQQAVEAEQPWQTIITSPAKRCSDFAKQLGEGTNLATITMDGFREIHFGDWEGKQVADIHQQQPEALENFWQNPIDHPPSHGETMVAFNERVLQDWRLLLQQWRGQHSLLISHGGVIRCILAQVLGMSLRPLSRLAVPHACLSRIEIYHQDGSEDWPQLVFHRPLEVENKKRQTDQNLCPAP